jgi:hypothetical protein
MRSRRFCGGRADRAVAACTGGRIAAVAGLRVCRRMEAGAVYTWVLIVVEWCSYVNFWHLIAVQKIEGAPT